MAGPTQFRHYLISQDAEGNNIEVVRSSEQVGVLAFDSQRLVFVHCHVLLEPLKNRREFDDRARKLKENGHPRMARLLDAGEDEGSPFYITENVDGESLRSYLSRFEQLPVWLAMRLTALSLEAARAVLGAGEFLPSQPLEGFRLVQTGPCSLLVKASDFRMVEPAGVKAARSQLAKSAFDKQEQFLGVFFLERLQTGASMQDATLDARDFSELLQNLLTSCSPVVQSGIASFLKTLEKTTPSAPAGELAAALKPKPLLAPLLAGFADVARSVGQQARIQSQKLDAAHPYVLRGTFTKTGQEIVVEQVPPVRMSGGTPAEILRQVQALPKAGKFPNLVPVVFVDENEGLQCMAETAVEGIALSDLLAERGTLEPQETYLVLAGMDAALGQAEKAGLTMRRLRLEDIFLFTGFGKDPSREVAPLTQKLNEWPGFSIVIRTHPCLHAMAGRGTNPGMLLPVDAKPKGEVEPIWNGGWMAALGCFLAGMPDGSAASHESGKTESDQVFRMLEDELTRARKGEPSSRPAFLARYARVIQHHDLAQPAAEGGFWAELSGSGAAQARVPEVVAASVPVAPPPVKKGGPPPPMPLRAVPPPPEKPVVGFAEVLIRQSGAAGDRPAGGGLQPMVPGVRAHATEVESSWRPLHEERPLWLQALIFFGGSLVMGAALAHLSGRAMWQEQAPLSAEPSVPAVTIAPEPQDIIDLPVAVAPSSPGEEKPRAPKLPVPTTPVLADVDLPAKAATIASAPSPAPPTIAAPPPSNPAAATLDPALKARLQELRLTGDKLPQQERPAVEKAARGGNTEAMLILGRMYLRGETGVVDERSAFTWFEKALGSGDANAAVPLAECYLQGWGTPPDFALAVDLLNRAVAAGDASAKDLLGVCYARGIGVTRDDAKAFALCSEAYAAGVVSACGNLGALYLRGQGVALDAERAVQLFAEGARRGHGDSMLLYAQSLEYGTGTPANRPQAEQWYQQAARLGNAEAANWCRQKGVTF